MRTSRDFEACRGRALGSKARSAPGAGGTANASGDRFRRMFRHLMLLIPAGVILNLALTASTTDLQSFFRQSRVAPGYVSLAVVLGFVPWLTHSLRMRVWTRFLGAKIPLQDLFCMAIGTDLGSAVSPTAVGGGYVKLGMLVERGLPPGAAASLMTLGSLEDGVFFAIAVPTALALASVGVPINGARLGAIMRDHAFLLSAAACCAAAFVVIALRLSATRAFSRRVAAAWNDCVGVYRLIARCGKTRFAVTMALTAVQWICRYSVISALLASLHVRVDPLQFFALQWVVFSMGVLVPTPGAAGGVEAAFMLVHRGLIPDCLLGIVTSGWRMLTFYVQLAAGSLVFGLLRIRSGASRNGAAETGTVAPSKP